MKRKLPLIGSTDAEHFCRWWDSSEHPGKQRLCDLYEVSYQMGKDYRSANRKVAVKEYELPPSPTLEDHFSAFKQIDKLVGYHHEVPFEWLYPIETSLPIGVVNTADWHLGEYGVAYDCLKADVGLMASEEGLYVNIGGDCYQNIIQPSKMGSSHNQQPISAQRGAYVLILKILLARTIAIGTGQHNYWQALLAGEDWDGELAKKLNVAYSKHAAIIHIKVGDFDYPLLRMHKTRFNSAFNLTHTCKQYQRMYFPQARIVVAEDKHIAAVEQSRYNDNECVYIRTGTYSVYDDFAQQNGFYGAYVANPMVVLYPNEDRLVAFNDFREGIIYLRAVRNGQLEFKEVKC